MIVITCKLCGSTNKIRFHEDHNKELCKECHNKIHRDKNKSKGTRKDGYTEYINSDNWKAKREEAFKHYGRKCTKCGSVNLLHVHHNTYVNFRHEEMKDLNVLCEVCHMALHDRINNRKIIKLGNVKVKKNKKTKGKHESNNHKRSSQKPHKTMLEVIESIKQTQANTALKRAKKAAESSRKIKEVKQPKNPRIYKENQIHIGIGTPSQRGYNKNNPLPESIPQKPKVEKTKKIKHKEEPVKVKTWLDAIQDEIDIKMRSSTMGV